MGYGSASSCATVILEPTLNRPLLISVNMSCGFADQVAGDDALLRAVLPELCDGLLQDLRPVGDHGARQRDGACAGEQEACNVVAVSRSVRADDRRLGMGEMGPRYLAQRERQRPRAADRG